MCFNSYICDFKYKVVRKMNSLYSISCCLSNRSEDVNGDEN